MMAFGETQIEEMLARLPNVRSVRQLAREMGIPLKTFQAQAAPYIAILRAQGALPPCACGKPRFHPFGCAAHPAMLDAGFATMEPERRADLLHRRQLFVSMLEGGARFFEIDAAMGATKGTARAYFRHLTPDQREHRADAMRRAQETANGR